MAGERVSPLGPVPDGWKLVRLGEVTTHVGSGATPRGGSAVYLDQRIRYVLVRSQNVFDRVFDEGGLAFISDSDAAALRAAELQADDVLLNITGDGTTFGRSCLVPRCILPACVNQHVVRIRCDERKCAPGYLVSYLTHPLIKPYIESFNAGGSRRAVTKGHIESFLLPLPPLPEQQAIACILGALDDKIELNRRMNQTLESMARAIFKSWFVDFDPVRAKAAGQQPPGLKPEIAALFPDAFEDSNLGAIPKGWRVGTVGEVCEFAYGRALKAEQRRSGVVPVMGSNGQVGTHDESLVKGPGVVVGRKGNPGIVTWVNTDFFPIDTTFYVVPLNEETPLTFLAFALDNLNLGNLGADSAVPGLNRNIAYKSNLVVPTSSVLSAFDRHAYAIRHRQQIEEQESRALAALRDALLPKLISGELRVPNAERIVGRCA